MKIVSDELFSPEEVNSNVSFAKDADPTASRRQLSAGPAPKLLQPLPIEVGGLLHGQVMTPFTPGKQNGAKGSMQSAIPSPSLS